MKIYISFLLGLLVFFEVYAQDRVEVTSPDKKIRLVVTLSQNISYDVFYNDFNLLRECCLNMQLQDRDLGIKPQLIKKKTQLIKEHYTPVVPLKFSQITSSYNSLLLVFADDYSIEFRVFDNGIAHRFITDIQSNLQVKDEKFEVNFPDDYILHLQQPLNFKTACEEEYSHIRSKSWKENDLKAILPLLIDTQKGFKILMSESALSDYPTMFLQGNGGNGFISVFPKVPKTIGEESDRSVKILEEEEYIASTTGSRKFPWRYFVITSQDKQLIENTMNYQLAEKNVLKDTSWIQPGMASWEWWSGATPYGPDVNFVAGCNQDTYKYYIDFASHYKIPYIVMDEGWAKTTDNPYVANSDINILELIQYAKEKNVGIILWLPWLTVEKNWELFGVFEEWGVRGIKIDFMERGDQWMVNFYERVAQKAAEHHLCVDFHGSFKPAGLEVKYPNVLSYEGVRGMERLVRCYPDNSIYLPFIRNAVGPMDYTPGAMLSMQPEFYCSVRPNAASIGTRAYQMALFIIFESGLQMMADNPTLYYKNAECTEFLTQIPQTWDETIALKAEVGEYVVLAKRKGDRWFIGGITNDRQGERQIEINLEFLDRNKVYQITSFEDGVNAKRQAMDYRKKQWTIKRNNTLKIRMARNGGFAAVIE